MIKDICIRIFEKFVQIFGINAALSPQMTMDSSFVNTQCSQTLRLQLNKEDKNNSKNSTQKSYAKNPCQRTNEYNIDFKIFLLILHFKKIFPISKMIA